MCLQPLKKQVVTFQGLFHQNFIPQLLLNKGLEKRMTIFQHDGMFGIRLRGNTDLDVASICNGVTRKSKSHCCCAEISCLLPYGMKMHRVDAAVIRVIIPQQRPFTSSGDQRSNWSLLEKNNNTVAMGTGEAQEAWSSYLGKGCCLA